MSDIPLFKNITTFCIFSLLLTFGVPSIGQTSVVVQDCTPEITGLQNDTYRIFKDMDAIPRINQDGCVTAVFVEGTEAVGTEIKFLKTSLTAVAAEKN